MFFSSLFFKNSSKDMS